MTSGGAPGPALTGQIPTRNVGWDVLSVLADYGVDTIFGIPGTHNLELYRHLPELDIHPVTTRHEQGAGYAADGWSMQTGLPGVVITTSGPGLLNVLSAAATSYAESRPMVVLAPGAPLGQEFADIGALHETKDTRAAADAVVEWARRVESGLEAVQAVHDAMEMFRTRRPRPVVIEIPLDVLEGPSNCPADLLPARPAPEPATGDPGEVDRAAGLLSGAVRPLILAGGGSVQAADEVRELAERLGAPVVTTLNGRAVLPESHPLAVGAALRLKAAHRLVSDADVLLVIGSKVGEAELWWGPLRPSGQVVRVDRLSTQLHKNITAHVGLVGEASVVVGQLLQALPSSRGPTASHGEERAAHSRAEVEQESREWAPASVACSEAIAAGLPEDVILGADSSQISYYGTANVVPLRRPSSYLYMATYATLGYGLPASIGAKIASPERPVVCVLGDGALMFSVQELMTAVEEDLDLVVVCVDNGGYREIEENEADRGIAPIGVRLRQPDWPALAAAFGGTGTTVRSAAELSSVLRWSIETGGVHLLHVPLSLFEPKEPGST